MSPSSVATQTLPEQIGTPARAKRGGVSSQTAADRQPDRDLHRVLKLAVPVTAVLAERDLTIESILAIAVGTIIEFDVPCDSDLTLRVVNRTIGSGEAVKIGENFGLRLTEIDTLRDRIDAMGGK